MFCARYIHIDTMRIYSGLFLCSVFFCLFNGYLSSNPDTIMVQGPEDNAERASKTLMEERQQDSYTGQRRRRIPIIRIMQPYVVGNQIVWREVGRESLDKFREASYGDWRGRDQTITRRTTEKTITEINRGTIVSSNTHQVPQNRPRGNNNSNYNENRKTNISPPVRPENNREPFQGRPNISPPAQIPPVRPLNKRDPFQGRPNIQETSKRIASNEPPKRASADSNFYAGIVNGFAFKLMDRMDLETNFVISPLSVFVALSMCYLGSGSRTKAQMEQVLGMNSNSVHGDQLHRGIQDLLSLVNGQISGDELLVANGMFLGKNFTFDPQFERNVRNYYDAEIQKLDFRNAELSMQLINQWVSDNTRNRITNIINSPPNALTSLILLNAVFFKGTWKIQFPLNLSKIRKFHSSDGTSKDAQFMNLFDETFPYYRSDEHRHTFVKLPYMGEQVSMVIALPYTRVKPMPAITDQVLCSVIDSMVDTKLDTLIIPKFRLDYTSSLRVPLLQLGLTDVFDRNLVDLSKLSRENDVFVSSIMHKAAVEVNEVGTTASASTDINFVPLIYRNTTNFIADHPFSFYIVHEPSGLVLFYGKVFDLGTNLSPSYDRNESPGTRPDLEPSPLNNRRENPRFRPGPGVEPSVSNNRRENAGGRPRSSVDPSVLNDRRETAGGRPRSGVEPSVLNDRRENDGGRPRSGVESSVLNDRRENDGGRPRSGVDPSVLNDRRENDGGRPRYGGESSVLNDRRENDGGRPRSSVESSVLNDRRENFRLRSGPGVEPSVLDDRRDDIRFRSG